jgi:hypothetical protein
MKSTKATLDSYKLTENAFLSLHWQDKRNGQPEVYSRHFNTASDLKDFLVEYFGVRAMRKVFSENVNLLP